MMLFYSWVLRKWLVRENFGACEGFILLVCALTSPKAPPGPWLQLISEFSSFTCVLLPLDGYQKAQEIKLRLLSEDQLC